MTTAAEAGAEMSWPRPPFTVDTLFELPDTGLRYEVLDGALVVVPPPTPEHNLAADRLRERFIRLLSPAAEAITTAAVRLPGGSGPVPDLLITTADASDHPRGIPAEFVHTVVEVVSPSNASDDRVKKAALYAAAGIPCYWRVELRSWREHFGPVPAIVVRLLGDDGEWHTTVHAAGETRRLPIVVDRSPAVVPVELDPAVLVGPRR
ncbi:Endonuclease, Uma2 family (restriction endonuclease fold) [Micromonospora pattaloongensis]|uniref:Endonuclease, Uma2 family (Restriction endonuclease fold) n=1 Tax=Micromonospora pattaloongensis TaxID=405436 RepID=A0A1H3MJV7_9ACTN|nr:Uma2 family endonuclease [Micromonospora pattaloongensis]SDY76604.1 Endonuclease, Uma2 family (restriction endonuclease fold) [Micromonospora pattaloongensis]